MKQRSGLTFLSFCSVQQPQGCIGSIFGVRVLFIEAHTLWCHVWPCENYGTCELNICEAPITEIVTITEKEFQS